MWPRESVCGTLSELVVTLAPMSGDMRPNKDRIPPGWAAATAELRALEPGDTQGLLDHAQGLDEKADAYGRLIRRLWEAVSPPRYVDPEKRSKLTPGLVVKATSVLVLRITALRAWARALRFLAAAMDAA
jgi:hypothetical protein